MFHMSAISFPPNRIAKSLAVGAYTNAGGGAFVRFRLADETCRFMALPAPVLFDFLDTIIALVEHRAHYDDTDLCDALNEFRSKRPRIEESDYAQIAPADAVTKMGGTELANGLLLHPIFQDGTSESVVLGDALAQIVKELLQETINKAGLRRPPGRPTH